MVAAMDAARYLISLDTELRYFTKNLITLNNCRFYEGNARLNKILHLANNIFIGKHGEKLIADDFYAYDNGGVIPEVQENYSMLLGTRGRIAFSVPEEEKTFLSKVYFMLKDAPIEELIDIDHEDPAWREKHSFYYKEDQRIDPLKYIEDYRDRYEAANFYIERAEMCNA